jgi:MinD-like ATPase involved in chromosome partitioning or flagellar assembly
VEASYQLPRSAVAIALPPAEFNAVQAHLTEAGYEAIGVQSADELEALLGRRDDVRVAILDGENDFDGTLEMYGLLHDGTRDIAALVLMPPRALGRVGLGGRAQSRDEYFTRPYSPESLRWRVEAMLIRVENIPSNGDTGPILGPVAVMAEGDEANSDTHDGTHSESSPHRGQIVIVFNPKGGVGKTTIGINLGAALQMRRHQRVLLIDCDTITGHIASSLGMANPRTVISAWRENEASGTPQTFAEIAEVHSSGMSVLVMGESPLHTEILEPRLVAEAVEAARNAYDWVILDMHPDYGPLNQALFELADKILVPVTPDVPCIRAAVQFREVAVELQIRDRLSLVINRANSGVSAGDVERVVGMPSLARVRSAGMLFVRAADEGKSAVERFPTAKVVGDIDCLAERLLAPVGTNSNARPGMRALTSIGGSVRSFMGRLTAQVS